MKYRPNPDPNINLSLTLTLTLSHFIKYRKSSNYRNSTRNSNRWFWRFQCEGCMQSTAGLTVHFACIHCILSVCLLLCLSACACVCSLMVVICGDYLTPRCRMHDRSRLTPAVQVRDFDDNWHMCRSVEPCVTAYRIPQVGTVGIKRGTVHSGIIDEVQRLSLLENLYTKPNQTKTCSVKMKVTFHGEIRNTAVISVHSQEVCTKLSSIYGSPRYMFLLLKFEICLYEA